MNFYVYMYLDKDNIPFYIGKGSKIRHKVFTHLQKKYGNSLLKNKIKKVGIDNIKIVFLHNNISEDEAFRWEKYWINYIGRRDLGLGSLCNMTDGGQGISGIKLSVDAKKRISEALIGNQHTLGRKHTEESKKKMSIIKSSISEEYRKKLIIARAKRGPISEETRKKMSESAGKKIITLETRRNLSNSAKLAWQRKRGEI